MSNRKNNSDKYDTAVFKRMISVLLTGVLLVIPMSGVMGVSKVCAEPNLSGLSLPSVSGNDSGSEVSGDEAVSSVDSISQALGSGVGAEAIVQSQKTDFDYEEAYANAKENNWGYINLGIANVEKNLNIRAEGEEGAKLVGKLPKDAACEVLEDDGEWAHITSGDVEGYVSLEYLFTGVKAKMRAEEVAVTKAYVSEDGLRVRSEPNTDSEIITTVGAGEELEVVDVTDDWVTVLLDDEEVYVSAEYVDIAAGLDTAVTMTELLYGQGVSDIRVDICQYAKEFLGNRYVWGGTSLTNGTDCSGFTMGVFKNFGIKLPHSSRSQAGMGTKINLSQAQPGDLVFYGKGSYINHVAIYIGNGQVIHASSPKTGIKISNVYYRTPLKVVRIIQD